MRCPSGLSGASYGGRAEPSRASGDPSEMRTALFRTRSGRSLEGARSRSLSLSLFPPFSPIYFRWIVLMFDFSFPQKIQVGIFAPTCGASVARGVRIGGKTEHRSRRSERGPKYRNFRTGTGASFSSTVDGDGARICPLRCSTIPRITRARIYTSLRAASEHSLRRLFPIGLSLPLSHARLAFQ